MKKSLLTKIGIFDYLRFLATFVVFLFGIQWVTAQCPTLVKVSVGECTNTGTGPRVLVAWYFDFDNSADVTITINDGNGNTFSKSIGPSHQGTPYYIQRIVTANGNTYNSTITYSGGCGSTSASYTLPAACNLNPSCGTGALGGRVFADYDLDGLQGGSEKGLKNVTVKIYNDAQNLVTTATSDINGNWLASGLTDGQKLRIEYDYSTFPTPIGYKLGKKAGSAGTTVQFATVPSCANNLGLFLEEIYSEPNPVVASIRFMNGDILSTDACSGAEQYLVITFNYNATNEQFGSEGFNVPVDRGVAKAKEVGSVWGMAWNKYTGHIYTSAFLRRHAGLGPNGIGAIYRSIQTAPGGAWTTSLLIDLAAAGYDLGQGDMDYTAAGRGLPACKNDPSRDIAAFSLIGKVGFGDIDLSSDGKTLYAMNLKNRSLIIMQLNDAGTAVLSHSEVVLPNPCADPYDWRPWGLKYYQGKVYVGGVNAGYSSVNKYPNDDYRRLRAYVYEYDPGTGVFSGPILKQPLDYPKTGDQSTTRWYIWEDTYSIQKSSSYNQPMLSDIEFDANGNILLAYADRGGYQWGWRNYLPHPTLTTLRDYFSNGDITKGYKNEPGIFLTEDNKVIGYDTGSGCGLTASQGPGGGEFYCGDNLHHPECAQGAIASHPSKNEMFMTYMDPVDIWSGGVGVLSHTTGQRLRGIEFYYMPGGAASGWHGKAGGVGDVELLSSPISAVKQVGNRIWIDLDIDGIQDPGESPLPNINVSLYDAGGTLIETTTTDANGEYYFEDYTPDATHYIVVGTGGQFNNGVLNNIYNMTVPNTGMGDIPDLNDSDGTAKPSGFLSGYPYIQITTPDIGQVNQSYDFGFYPCEITSLGAEALCDDNGTGTFLDDFFTIRVNPVGSGTSPNYNVTVVHDGNTTTYGPYSFGAASPYFGNFPIDGGNAQVTVTDAATGGCTLGPVTVNAPATCSFCEVSEANIQVECVNNNTETPSDDKFRLSVDPTGIGLGANYTVVVVHSGITYNYGPFTYGAPSPTFGNYLITGGDATVSIIDGAAPGCELGPETVKAPAYCSPYFFGCDDDSVIELLSTGVNCGSNPQTQITIPDPGSVTEVVVEVVYLNSYPGNSITVQSNFGNHTFNRVDVLGDNSEVYVYRGYLPAGTSSVSHNSATGQCGNGNGLQSLVSYVIRTVLGNNSVHSLVYTALSGYCDLQEFSIPVAANDYPRDIVVRLPITELSTDGTYMTITAEAGGVEESITIYGPPPGTCCINEVEITIPEVPGAANVVNVSIDTRSSSNPTGGGCGQSWVIAGHALVEAGCPEPIITHEKVFSTAIQTGPNSFDAIYLITVMNSGGAAGVYSLTDQPMYDDDVNIHGASFTSTAPGNPGTTLAGNGPWLLGNNINILAGAIHSYIVNVQVSIDLEDGIGDDQYDECQGGGSGSGLFNMSLLDVDGDTTEDETDEDCGELPYITHEKTISSVTQTTANTYNVVYQVVVQNTGGVQGQYDLSDAPVFDDDITINGANFTSTTPGNPGSALAGVGPWVLGDDINIAVGATHTYTLTVNVTLDLRTGTPGDNIYKECGDGTPGVPAPGEGLFNRSLLDKDNDGIPDETDEVCADLPYIIHEKTISSVTQTTANTYNVVYQVVVQNTGGAQGQYDLSDAPMFDNDITINSANYTSTAPGNAGSTLAGSGPWVLGNNININAGATHTYTLTVNVTLDLRTGTTGDNVYKECGDGTPGVPAPGEGLFNRSLLDVNNDGTPDQTDEVCGDLPYITHEKTISSVSQTTANTYNVVYQVVVRNTGGLMGQYDLSDTPIFDNDIAINSASYVSTAPGNAGSTLAGSGPWVLGNNINIAVGAIHTYTLTVNVTLDLRTGTGGDNIYRECGDGTPGVPAPGEGLFNRSLLDVNNDGTPDETDEVCADLPYIIHEKTISSVTQTAANNYNVVYQVVVQNIGGAQGQYDLTDAPMFDNDIAINNASYASTAPGNAGSALAGIGPWVLGNDINIPAGTSHTYTLTVNVTLDLRAGTTGDNIYKECGDGTPGVPAPGEGLFNRSLLDVNNDSTPDETDEVCADLPYIIHEKTVNSVTQTGPHTYDVVYQVVVQNIGGANGQYDLNDAPAFDDDITINNAGYTSTAPGNAGSSLAGNGPWVLGNNVNIAFGATHTYTVTVNVTINLDEGTTGNNIYTACGETNPGIPTPGEGLFNRSLLDVNNDGTPDETDEACEDLPYIIHEKVFSTAIQTGPNSFDAIYLITVMNNGGASGIYTLRDQPMFDDDVIINSAEYSSTAPGNPGTNLLGTGPWFLGIDQSISAGAIHSYVVTVGVTIDLEDDLGDDEYDECEGGGPGSGMFNMSFLDVNGDTTEDETDEDCGEIPYVTHEKTISSVTQTAANTYNVVYQVVVQNIGGAEGQYDLTDAPMFDNDIAINNAVYTSTAPGNPGSALAGNGPWILGNDITIPAGEIHTYTLTVNVTLDLRTGTTGDNVYRECGDATPGVPAPGEGLFNRSLLDKDNDGTPDETDEVCADLPYIIHDKTVSSVTQTTPNTYNVVYQVVVQNIGGAQGQYDLNDAPIFDDDVTINAASYISTAPGNPGNALAGIGPWVLGNDINIFAGASHTYTLTVNVTLDLRAGTPGNNVYRACGQTSPGVPTPGEGLFNRSLLDVNNDGTPDQTDEVCADLPYIVHEKTVQNVERINRNAFEVTYQIAVRNLGGATGVYDLTDQPIFDDDLTITGSNYTSNAPGNAGSVLPGNGPWTLANDQAIIGGGVHIYTVTVQTVLDISNNSPGDNVVTNCGSSTPGVPTPEEGFFNRSLLDINNDGTPDEIDEVCEDVPYVDVALRKRVNAGTPGPYKYGDIVSFDVEVFNQGNVPLSDIEIVDYIPCGLTYVSGTPSWTLNANQARVTLVGVLAPKASRTIRIDFRIGDCLTEDAWLNITEVMGMEDANGKNVSDQDIDSSPDNDKNNDAGGLEESPADNYVNGDGTGTIGDGVADTDEDDHDPALIPVFDLALRKQLLTSAPYTYNTQHTFRIEVFNQGNVAAYNVEIGDYIPAGYTFVGGLNPLWTIAGSTASTVLAGPVLPGTSTTIDITLVFGMTQGGNTEWFNYAEILSAEDENGNNPLDADSNPDSDSPYERQVIPGGPYDNVVTGGGSGVNEDEDDHDPAGPYFYDLALRKTTTATGPFSYGQIVKFDIEVFNQSNLPVRNIRVIDYIPSGFTGNSIAQNFPTWSFGPNGAVTTLQTTLNPGQSTVVSIYLQVIPTNEFSTGWDNYAEIYRFEDLAGNNVGNQDIDSSPDTNENNDGGGQPYSPADNFVMGDGTGVPGDGVALTDEDDHDPERIEIIDLALRKVLITDGPYAYNDLLHFEIEVFNQGNEPMRNIEITDYIPQGYSFSLADNIGWTGSWPNPQYVIAGPLMPEASTTVNIYLRIEQTTGGYKHWINYAEITDAFNNDGDNRSGWDIDSNPGSNSVAENSVLPDDPEDDDITRNDKGGIEDDHDPAGIEIFDLALYMVNDTDILGAYGDDVRHTVYITNQGSIPSDGFDITVYVPAGYAFNAGDNPGWTDIGGGQVRYTSPAYLEPGQTLSYDLLLEAVPVIDCGDGWLVYAEISRDNSIDPDVLTDFDSRPDAMMINDAGGAVNTTSDDVVTGIGIDRFGASRDIFGSVNPLTDEDDHDPATIRVMDLALYKQLITTAPFQYGDVHEFSICVVNQGNEPMYNIEITDYMAEGYSFDPAKNTGWVAVGNNLQRTLSSIAVCDTVCMSLFLDFEQTTGGRYHWINYAEITQMEDGDGVVQEDVDSRPGSDGPDERGVYPGDPADDDTDSIDKGGEEDDHDPAGPKVFDLALWMENDTEILGAYGDDVTHTIYVTNQGNIASDGFDITVYVPEGYQFNAGDNPGWTDNGNGTVTYASPDLLNPGQTLTYDLLLEAVPVIDCNDGWLVYAEISDDQSVDPLATVDIDSRPDATMINDAGGAVNTTSDDVVTGIGVNRFGVSNDVFGSVNPLTDEDDHDPATIRVIDLALYKKLLTAGPYRYGQILDFEICVVNQGNEPMYNVELTDYLPQGFVYEAAANAINWNIVGTDLSYVLETPVTVCDTICIPLRLRVVQTDGGADHWINYSEITGMEDESGDPQEDVDSTPGSDGPDERDVKPGDDADDDTESTDKGGEEDDHDPSGIYIYDLALRKTQVDAQSSFRYGDLVTLNMEVFNQGNTGARDIELVDYLPCGMEFVNNASNTANGWTYDENTSEVRTVISNVVEAGASISRILVVRVVECYEDVANAWTNIVEIEGGTNNDTGEPGDDFDSTPDDDPDNDEGGEAGTDTDDEINGDPNNPDNPNAPQDEDDHDPHRIQVFDLALKKTVDDRGPYMIGEVATFRFMVYNQGNVVVQNVNVRDYLRRGFVFHQADNAGWTLTTPAGANPGQHGLLEFTITEAISAGDSVEISVDLEIGLPIGGVTELDWWNYAEIGTAEDLTGAVRTDDADSTPGSDSAYENDVEPDDPWDNEIKGGGPGVAEDEDDHDPEKVIVVGGLGDTVWLDEDGDGTQEPGEPGVGGVTVKLTDCAGHILATQVTDANGFYFFNNLVPGWYQIVMDNTTVPDGLWWTYQNIGADDEIDSDVDFNGVGPCVFITGGQYDSTYDAGLLILAKLGDFVWHDLNGDGMQDAGEPGISGVVVKLHNAAGVVIRTTTTDASGYYLFDDLYPGNYYVQFVQPAGYTDLTLDHQGWDRTKDSNVNHANGQGTTSWITLNPGDVNLTIDAGYYKCVEIGDLLWCDYDYDDKWDNEENGINGLLVNLWRYHLGEWILWDYTYTAHKPGTPSDDGYWYFCAMPGTYYVEIPIPPYGLVPVLPKVGNDPYRDSDLTDANGPGTTDAFTLPSGAKKLDIGAGYYLQACMTNLVWFDENNNGVKDENESGMPGVTVQAYKMGGQLIGTAVTNSQGYFYIEGLRKYAYYLKVTAPNGYTFTTPYSNGNRDMINSDFDHSNGWGTSANYPLNPGECVDLACGLIFSSLPVELIEFRGEYRPDYNYLEWATEREEHSGSFVIERKYENEAKFEQIAEVAAVGNSVSKQTYNLNDYNIPEDGVYYYRLNQLDQDGISRFSKVIAIVVDRAKTTDLSLYPNPTRDRFEIDMSMAQAAFVQIDMFDAQGKLVRKNIMNSELQKGRYTHVVELNGMSEGVYTVRIKIGEKMINKKLVIMH